MFLIISFPILTIVLKFIKKKKHLYETSTPAHAMEPPNHEIVSASPKNNPRSWLIITLKIKKIELFQTKPNHGNVYTHHSKREPTFQWELSLVPWAIRLEILPILKRLPNPPHTTTEAQTLAHCPTLPCLDLLSANLLNQHLLLF